MTWWEYVEQISADDKQNVVAAKAGVDQGTVSRWKNTNAPGKAENVAALARAYNRPVLEAFVAAGFLTAEEARQRPTAAPTFESMTNEQLADLVRQRLLNRGGERGGDTPAMNQSRGLRVAARTVGEKTPGQKRRDALEGVGEESQGEGPEGGA